MFLLYLLSVTLHLFQAFEIAQYNAIYVYEWCICRHLLWEKRLGLDIFCFPVTASELQGIWAEELVGGSSEGCQARRWVWCCEARGVSRRVQGRRALLGLGFIWPGFGGLGWGYLPSSGVVGLAVPWRNGHFYVQKIIWPIWGGYFKKKKKNCILEKACFSLWSINIKGASAG